MGGFVKGHDTLVVTGYRGYDTKTFRRHQTESNFLHWTWPNWFSIKPVADESIGGLVFPVINLHKAGVRYYRKSDLVIPVTVTVTVDFGVPCRRDDDD